MKSKKCLVRVKCTSRKFYVQWRPERNSYYIRFWPPKHLRKAGQGVVHRSLDTDNLATAKERARVQIESFWGGGEIRMRSDLAKLGEIAERYLEGARTIPDKEDLKTTTINGNVGALRKLVGVKELDGICSSVLTGELVEAFKVRQLSELRADPVKLESGRRSVNSTIRQARSLFAPEYLPLYRELPLPDLTSFRAARLCKVDAQGMRYIPIPQVTIDAMEQEIRAMRESRPALYLAFYMMLWLGMRQNEVCEARLEWLEEWPNGARMAIVRRPYFKPKGISGAVAVAPALLEDLKTLSGAVAPLDYLIPAAHITERKNLLRYDLSQLVRRHLGAGRQKTCHELRKHAISMQLMRTRNYVDTLKFSRHSDVRTLQKHYDGFLDELAPITSSNWRDAA